MFQIWSVESNTFFVCLCNLNLLMCHWLLIWIYLPFLLSWWTPFHIDYHSMLKDWIFLKLNSHILTSLDCLCTTFSVLTWLGYGFHSSYSKFPSSKIVLLLWSWMLHKPFHFCTFSVSISPRTKPPFLAHWINTHLLQHLLSSTTAWG